MRLLQHVRATSSDRGPSAARTLAPATWPLCEMRADRGHARPAIRAHSMPGIAGREVQAAGRHHPGDIAAVVRRGRLRPPAQRRRPWSARPTTGLSAASGNRLANSCSSSVHFGMPTASMFFWIASAIALLTSCGQAEAAYLHVIGRAGHQRGALGDLEQLVVGLLGRRHGGVAHEPPDLAVVRNDVGLDAADRDRAMGAIGRAAGARAACRSRYPSARPRRPRPCRPTD